MTNVILSNSTHLLFPGAKLIALKFKGKLFLRVDVLISLTQNGQILNMRHVAF